ncbi:MAG: thioredoxin family protein [Bacteroidales bacterium]|nr:thioredoxin family protein [Bacteroidales bacterium]
MKKVKVLISGCACNSKFADLVEKVVSEQSLDMSVARVTDIEEVMRYNVMSLPALVVDEQVVARGVKTEKELVELLK